LKFLARAIRQEEEIKGIQIGKEEVKLLLFSDHLILCLKELKNSTKKFLGIKTFGKISVYKISLQISEFLHNNKVEREKWRGESIQDTIYI
jgi:hypothetical protein